MKKGIASLAFTFIVLVCILCSSALGSQGYVFVDSWPEDVLGFRNPLGVAVDESGNIYVAEYGNHRIQKFDSEGNLLARWGTRGPGDGQFDHPRGVAVDGSGNVYVADTGNNRIQKFDSGGGFLTTSIESLHCSKYTISAFVSLKGPQI